MAWMKAMQQGGHKNKTIQYENHYAGQVHPHADKFPHMNWWHPKPTLLNLVFTHTGEWVKVPRNRGTKGGPDYYVYHVGRLERYIDTEGITKSAVAWRSGFCQKLPSGGTENGRIF